MSQADFELTVLGTRGSMACARSEFSVFGGDTSCYCVRAGEDTIFLDAGTGLLNAPTLYARPPVVLLSHLHLDHVIGLGMFPGLSIPGQGLRIHVPFCESREAAERALERVYSPPLWPLKLTDSECRAKLIPMAESFTVGEVTVETMLGCHPGNCMVLRLGYRGKSLVYATDFEHEESAFARLSAFAHGADLLLYDAQFSPDEYRLRRGFGHSTADMGLELWRKSRVKRLLLIHHAPWSSDKELLVRDKLLPRGASYAREGQVLAI